MPSTVKVKVVAARNLPVMDRLSYLTDAFVEVRLGNVSFKTDVVRRTLNPSWNSDWYKFEVDDEELQEEALQIRVLDHDTYSSHDAIGRVYFDLNPLLDMGGDKVRSSGQCPGNTISGWFPIYDTMHGIRGEIQLMVRVESFLDSNKYRQSSIGVKFFYSSCLPMGFRMQSLLGFVEELVINDDPEYQWREKIRTSRASNEARQRLFNKVNGELQRKIGLKVLDLGGNSVIGYQLHFDIEGQTGVVVRGIGTAALLVRTTCGAATITPPISPTAVLGSKGFDFNVTAVDSVSTKFDTPEGKGSKASRPGRLRISPSASSPGLPRGFSKMFKLPSVPPAAKSDAMAFVDFPFLTISSFPPGFLVHIGGVVAAKSVKLLDREEVESRDAWWAEIRTEMRSHMRSLACQTVIGYREEASIFEDVVVLSAAGTAVTVNLQYDGNDAASECSQHSPQPLALSLDRVRFTREKSSGSADVSVSPTPRPDSPEVDRLSSSAGPEFCAQVSVSSCGLVHVPYSEVNAPFPVILSPCGVCGRHRVPPVIFASIDRPATVTEVGRPALVQARVCRTKREHKGEAAAKEISDALPFIEYELYNQLVHKIKLKGMNSIFGLRIKISVGEDAIISVGTGTAYALAPLPVPQLPKISTKMDEVDLGALQCHIQSHVMKNKEFYQVDAVPPSNIQAAPPTPPANAGTLGEEDSDSESLGSDLDLAGGAKDAFVIEVDDMSSEEVHQMLLDNLPPAGMTVATTEHLLGDEESAEVPVLFARMWRSSMAVEKNRQLANVMEGFNAATFFKLSRLTPCLLSKLDYNVSITDDNQLQILLMGACQSRMERRQAWKSCVLTPLSRPPGVVVEAYLGNMDFFFVWETTSLREFEDLSGFLHMCMAEVQSVVRAHATSIGANAVLSYHLSDSILVDTPGRNQAQCLLNVCGDMARVSIVEDPHHP